MHVIQTPQVKPNMLIGYDTYHMTQISLRTFSELYKTGDGTVGLSLPTYQWIQQFPAPQPIENEN